MAEGWKGNMSIQGVSHEGGGCRATGGEWLIRTEVEAREGGAEGDMQGNAPPTRGD